MPNGEVEPMPFVKTAALRIFYQEKGSGPRSVVFLHGNLSTSRWWQKVFQLLPDEYHAYAPDMRGCGRSDRPEDGYSLSQLTEDLREFCHELNINSFALVGHSLGGAVALQFAINYQSMVRALVLACSVPAEGLRLADEMLRLLEQMSGNREAIRETFLNFAPDLIQDDYFENLIDDALGTKSVYFFEVPRSLAGLDLSARLEGLKVPTLILWGDKDPLISLDATMRMHRAIGGSRLEILKGAGHAPQLERPEEFACKIAGFFESVVWAA